MLWSELNFLIRSLQGRDLLRLLRLWRRGSCLDVERRLVSGYPFFRIALRSWVRWDARTYLGHDPARGMWYILQATAREDRPEWDVSFLAPARATSPVDREQWRRLVQRAVRDALHRGVYRLYVSLPVGSPLIEVFRQEGFRPYMREQVFRLAEELPRAELSGVPGAIRPYTDVAAWEFRRLWQRVTPQVVATAEGLLAQNGLAIPRAWTPRPDNRLYLWWQGDTLVGAAAVRFGPRGRVLRFLLDPTVGPERAQFVTWMAYEAQQWGAGHIYCALPEYVGGVHAVLEALGFVPWTEHVLMVRHLAVALHADAAVPQANLSWADIGGEPALWQPARPTPENAATHRCRAEEVVREPQPIVTRTKQVDKQERTVKTPA